MKLKPLPLAISLLMTTAAVAANEEVIVTGTYSPVNASQLSSSVSVINQEELQKLSSHSLVDALRQVPSIWVEEQGGPGGLTAISLRGAESNHTLVLLDGVQLNDPTNTRGGAFDLGNININSVKRIEVIRGAQSAIYGSDALAGVIHIITLEATDTAQHKIYAAVGEDGYKTTSFTTSGKIDRLGYAVKAQIKDAGEPIKGSTAENKEVITKLNWAGAEHNFDFLYRYFDGEKTSYPEQSGGPLFAQTDLLDQSEYTDQNAAFSWQWQVNDIWKSKVQASWFNRDEIMSSPGIAPYTAVPANGANTDFSRTSFSWINTLGNQKTHWANIGVETKKESGDSQGYMDVGFPMPTDFDLSRRIDSAFINLNSYVTSDFLVQASLRRDDAEDIAAKNSAQVGARYQITEQLNWYANWGEGFKLASFFALGHPLVGNPDLKPETSTSWDTGVEWNDATRSLRVSYFDNRYRDLIDFDPENFTNVNRARVDTSGAEVEANWLINPQWQLGAHASYADIDAENPLMGRPKVKAGSSLGYTLNDSWQFNLNYLWVDERFATSQYTGDAVLETQDNYSRFDGSVKWQVNSQLQLNLNIENLTDEDYYNEIGFPGIGRAVYLSASFSL
jgi:vitamin B12 transporter